MLAANLAGVGSASAQTLTGTIAAAGTTSAAQLSAQGSTAVAAGTALTIHGASYGADEPVGFWINVPDGTTISNDSLGQTDTQIAGSVTALDAMVSTDDAGTFTYTVDTSGLPSGSYSMVAHGLESNIEGVFAFTNKYARADTCKSAPARGPARSIVFRVRYTTRQ
jgi:hypothetical protein